MFEVVIKYHQYFFYLFSRHVWWLSRVLVVCYPLIRKMLSPRASLVKFWITCGYGDFDQLDRTCGVVSVDHLQRDKLTCNESMHLYTFVLFYRLLVSYTWILFLHVYVLHSTKSNAHIWQWYGWILYSVHLKTQTILTMKLPYSEFVHTNRNRQYDRLDLYLSFYKIVALTMNR